MRKSTWVMIGILMAALGGMLFAANAMLGPMSRDAELSGNLTRFLDARGDIQPGTRVLAFRSVGSAKRLAAEGRGFVVELTPSETVRTRPGGLRTLSRLLVRTLVDERGAGHLDWVELRLRIAPDPEVEPFRTLVQVDPEGDVGEPEPAPPTPGTPAPSGPSAPLPARPAR